MPTSISFDNVSKVYKLYPSPVAQMTDTLGLHRFVPWRRANYPEFQALDNVSLTINKGERVGIIGRNGAGKTTLLKLITGNFKPTSGKLHVNGSVQALMIVGLGFHPDFTGIENIRSSLLYNGLSGAEYEAAVADVVEFVELGDFLYQPVKTYSLGMGARLEFAAATAIRPEIMIVDEVLGAGDAYFGAKSADRMEKLASSGCTLLLVSHAMPQVLQFCERAIWLENGRIILDSDALTVVKAYEEYMQKLQREANLANKTNLPKTASSTVLESPWLREKIIHSVLGKASSKPDGGNNISAGGVSRWRGEGGLQVENVRVRNRNGEDIDQIRTREELSIEITIRANNSDDYRCSYVVVLLTEGGQILMRDCSQQDSFRLTADESRTVQLKFPELLLGNGKYIFSVALYRDLNLANLGASTFYDLLSRSFTFEVVDEYRDDPSLFHHPSHWEIEKWGGDNSNLP